MGSLSLGGFDLPDPTHEQDNPVYRDEVYWHSVYKHMSEIPFLHIQPLGRGTFGYVDKVRRGVRVYARKTIFVPLESSIGSMQSVTSALENEVKIIQMARHAHIVSVNATYMCRRDFAIIMTPVADENLEEYLHRIDSTPMNDQGMQLRRRILPWFGCLISGMDYLHSLGIRHRDIKPSNILITKKSIFLTDFGIAIERPGDTTQTETDTIGTKLYRAPEVADGIRSGRRADIFSLGAVFLELLSVCSGQGKLAHLKEHRQQNGDRSYARNLDRLTHWIATLATGPNFFWGYSTVLVFCSQMLQNSREARPTAHALWSCWSHQLELPTCCLHCLRLRRPALEEPDSCFKDLVAMVMEGVTYSSLDTKADELSSSGLEDNIHQAARQGSNTKVFTILCAGADNGKADAYGRVALHWAVLFGHRHTVGLLLANGVNVDYRDPHGLTSLCLAARLSQDAVVQVLLENRANPNAKTLQGHTALHLVHSVAVAKLLLDYGANIDEQDSFGYTPLRYAVFYKDNNVVRILLERGADIRLKSKGGSTVLDTAFQTHYRSADGLTLLETVSQVRPKDSMEYVRAHSRESVIKFSPPGFTQPPLLSAQAMNVAPSRPPNPFARPLPKASMSAQWPWGRSRGQETRTKSVDFRMTQ